MKSVKPLINTLCDNVKSIRGMKKKTVITTVVIIVLFAVGFISFVIYNDYRAESRYNEIIESINSETLDYNNLANRYNDLISGLKTRHLDSNDSSVSIRKMITPDYEAFKQKGSDYNALSNLLDTIKSEMNSVETKYNMVCSDATEKLCNDYNNEVDKYNSMLERLSSYENIMLPDDAKAEETISSNKKLYKDNNAFFASIDQIMRNKERIASDYYSLCLDSYNDAVKDYNIVAEEYNRAVKETSIDFIKGLNKQVTTKKEYEDSEIACLSEDELCSDIEKVFSETDQIVDDYLVVTQITNPTQSFVNERLKEVNGVTGIEGVTATNDPNGLLGKEGGYTSCLYFAFKDVDGSSVPGNSIVDKGTDGGGAVEIYKSLNEALNRCDYLSQFDGTLLYSGSYAIAGTMVIRTSYKLSDKQQVDLTNDITLKLTELK